MHTLRCKRICAATITQMRLAGHTEIAHRATIGVLVLCALLIGGCTASPAVGTGGQATNDGISSEQATAPRSTVSARVARCTAAVCIAPGDFTTSGFLDGQLTVTVPEPWESGEDQTAEFSGAPVGASSQHRLLFWMDILPVDPAAQLVTDVPLTAAGMVSWLDKRPNLQVSDDHQTTVGAAHLPATVVDIAIAPDAENEDKGCPGPPCVGILTWPDGGTNIYGIGVPAVVRLYLSDVVYDGTSHLFAIAIEAASTADLESFAPVATVVIDSATAPLERR